MKPFCEIIVADVLPAFRALITDELSKTYGLSQTQISKKLGITQPAISQYKRELRGKKTKAIMSNKKIMQMIKRLSHDIATKDIDSVEIHKRLCEICRKAREEGLICSIHRKCASMQTCDICLS